MKRLDIIIIAIIIAISAVSAAVFALAHRGNYQKKFIDIKVQGKPYKTIPIDNKTQDTFTIKTSLGTNIVKIENGGVRIADADCPDKICVKDGFIDKPGQVLVCLPHKLIIEIKGQKNEQTDELSY